MGVVGRPVKRNDAVEKLTGRARYVDDGGYEGMLYGATVRSPRPHIFIKRLKDGPARMVDGFVHLVTSRDVPGRNCIPLVMQDHPVLADGEARFAGEAIALVAATSPEAARQAAESVRVEYEDLPAVTDPLEAMKPDAPRIFGEDNCFRKFQIVHGDGDRGFAKAQVTVEGTFRTGYQAHAYLETQGMIAVPQADGGMLIEGSLQCPYYVHDAVACALGIPSNKVRIVQLPTGGGFGGKEDVPSVVACHAAVLARSVGRPVKLIYTREEDFLSMSKRHPSWVKIRYGAQRDGTLVACEVRYVLDCGAYSTLSPVVLWRGTVHATGPYRIPHVKIESLAMATHKVPCGAFRGFGQPQVCFANESLIDELAAKLGMDPYALRQKNAFRLGDRTATDQEIKESCGMTEALERVKAESEWDARRQEFARDKGTRRRGIGASATYYGVCLGALGSYLDRAAAHVQIEKDGSVIIACGQTEVGQGAWTALAQIAADGLNCPYESVKILDTDTTRVPDSGPTVASRTTVMSGNAILDACRKLRARMLPVAAQVLAAPEDAIAADGAVFSGGGQTLSFQRLASECWKRKVAMSEQGWYASPPTSFDDKGQGDAYVTYTYSANVAEVEVDTATGEVTVTRVTAAHDIGKAVNPREAEGQVQGGVMQGLAYGLLEDLVVEDGVMKNGSFAGYILPTSADAPVYRSILLEHAYPAGPFGAKGLGEPPLIGVAPAIANAIRHATGARIDRIPALPEVVLEAIDRLEGKTGGEDEPTDAPAPRTTGGPGR